MGMGMEHKKVCTTDSTQKQANRKRVSAFTLVEMMIVMAIIAALTAIITPLFFDFIERANETADITNMHNMINAVNRAFLVDQDDRFFDCVWGVTKGHEDNANFGYIYVDNDEVRVSNPVIAELLEEQGYIVKADAPDRLRGGVEPSYYFKKGSRLKCQASRKWCRYQISFRQDPGIGGLWWGVTCANRSSTSVDSNGTIRQDAYDRATSEDVASRVGAEAYDRALGGQE